MSSTLFAAVRVGTDFASWNALDTAVFDEGVGKHGPTFTHVDFCKLSTFNAFVTPIEVRAAMAQLVNTRLTVICSNASLCTVSLALSAFTLN